MNAIFNMETVMVVNGVSKLTKDRKQRETRPHERKKNDSAFARVFETAVREEEAPAQYKTVVYGRNGLMSTTNYRTRNY